MSTNKYTFNNTRAFQFNDVVYPGSPFLLDNYYYNFSIKPHTKFWRFGIRLSTTENIEFFHPHTRYQQPEFSKNYKDIHIGAGDKFPNWSLPNRLSLTQYNFGIKPSVSNKTDKYTKFEKVEFSVKYNLITQKIEVGVQSSGCEPFIESYDLDEKYKYFKIFAWADSIDYKLDCDITVDFLNKDKNIENHIIAIEVGKVFFRFGDMFDSEIIKESSLVVIPAASEGTVSKYFVNKIMELRLPL